jgi:uncharacterized SAM-binding protein YcdF (DUF218 family)
MFYYASKIAWFFATPSNLLPALVVLGLLLMLTRLRRTGWALAFFGGLGLFAGGLGPVANWLIIPLEERFPAFRDDGRPIAGVIVLGGAVEADEALARGQLTINEAGERVIALADLARRYPSAKIVFSGGGSTLVVDEAAEAEGLSRFIGALGLSRERLTLETRSRTTRENALHSRELLNPRPDERWLLVTSAWHMPRAIGCFWKAGFAATPYPVDYRTRGPGDAMRFFPFTANGLRRLDLAAKEWIGLLAYRLAGYTDALFPGPEAASPGSASR